MVFSGEGGRALAPVTSPGGGGGEELHAGAAAPTQGTGPPRPTAAVVVPHAAHATPHAEVASSSISRSHSGSGHGCKRDRKVIRHWLLSAGA